MGRNKLGMFYFLAICYFFCELFFHIVSLFSQSATIFLLINRNSNILQPSPIFSLCCNYFLPVCFYKNSMQGAFFFFLILVNSFKVLCLVEEDSRTDHFCFPIKIEVIIIPDQSSTVIILTNPLAPLVCLKELLAYFHVPERLQNSGMNTSSCRPFQDPGLLHEPQGCIPYAIFFPQVMK